MNKVKLGDLLEIRRGTTLPSKYYSKTGLRKRLTLGNFNYPNGGFKENTSKEDIFFIGDVKPEYILKKDDIITPLTEQVHGLLGETARIPLDDVYVQSGDIGLVIPNSNKLDNKFAYYLISSPVVKKQLSAGAQQTKIRHTSPDKIKDCQVYLPDLSNQKKIGVLLNNIDHKIKINNKINDELEAMAKTIYDYWFLQFEFPNEEGKPYKSSGGKMVWNRELKREIPEGWSIETLGDLLKNEKKAVLKQNINKKIYTPLDSIPCKKMSLKQIKAKGAPNSSLISYEKDALLFGAMRPYFHRVCIAPFEGITRTTVFTLYPKDLLVLGYAFETLNQDLVIKYATDNSIGTQQPYAVWENSLEKMIIPKVPDCLKYMYSKRIEGIIRMVQNNEMESSQLISLRDFILPLLMNGQVGFKENKAEG